MGCIHKQYNEVQKGCYCDCLNKLYCNQGRQCNFYQSDKRYKHDLPVESNGMKYNPVIDTKPWLNHKEKIKAVIDNSGRNYQMI